jgi:hypothetical protein
MIGIIAGVLTSLGALITALGTRRKLNAEAESSLSDSAMEMVRELRIEVAAVKAENVQMRADQVADRKRITKMEQENKLLRAGITLLCGQLTNLGQTPLYQPAPAEKDTA